MISNEQKETVEKLSVTSKMEGGKIKTRVTLYFESGLKYSKSYYGFSEKLENIQVGTEVRATVSNGNVIKVVF